jgi:hypothetical protein
MIFSHVPFLPEPAPVLLLGGALAFLVRLRRAGC